MSTNAPTIRVPILAVAIVLTVLAAPAEAKRAKHHLGTVYAGPVAREYPMVLTLTKSGRLAGVVLSERAQCNDGDSYHYAQQGTFADSVPAVQLGKLTFKGRKLSKSGKFKASAVDNEPSAGGDSTAIFVDLKGKVGRSAATGTLHFRVVNLDAAGNQTYHCDSGTAPWSLGSARGRIFGGVTSQGTPVEVKLTADRSSVDTFAIDWNADCAPGGGSIGGPTALFALPMRSDGSFDSDQEQAASADGSVPDVTGLLGGVVKGRTASGLWSLSATYHDAAGAANNTCHTGGMSWKAASS
jgi:hypothetical protein